MSDRPEKTAPRKADQRITGNGIHMDGWFIIVAIEWW